MIHVIILTFNESLHIRRAVQSALEITSSVFVIDSFSTDDTVQIACGLGATVYKRAWKNHSDQFNWGLEKVGAQAGDWIFRLDADEYLSNPLIQKINSIDFRSSLYKGFSVNRRIVFQGDEVKYGGVGSTYIVRFFEYGFGRSETKLMDEHIVINGKVGTLRERLYDNNLNDLEYWFSKHLRYAKNEAIDYISTDSFTPNIGFSAKVRRFMKSWIYYSFPTGLRPFVFYFYRMFIRMGVFDTVGGKSFHFFQCLVYRRMVDSEISKRKQEC